MKSLLTILLSLLIFSGLSNPNWIRSTEERTSIKQASDDTSWPIRKPESVSQDCNQQLVKAAKENNLELAENLLAEGCDVNARIEVGANIWESPLYCALGHTDSKMVRLLLKYGADPFQDLGREMTPFHCSAGVSIHETFLLLLDKCKNVNILNIHSNFQTPLICAIALGNFENVKSLVEKGAKIDPDSSNGMSSPLYEACWFQQLNIFKFLLMKGANVNARFTLESGDCMPCPNGITVLHELVAMNSHMDHKIIKDFLDVLIKYKPKMNVESDFGMTALEFDCFGNDTILVRWLIVHGSKLETDDYCALHCAAMFSNYKMVEFLLKLRVNPNSQTKEGDTPLIVSFHCCGDGFGERITAEDRLKTARLLLAYGADPYLKNKNNESFINLCNGSLKRPFCDSLNLKN
jgi:ankyrin repeat protein